MLPVHISNEFETKFLSPLVCGPPPPVEGYVIGEPTALTCGSTVSVQCAEGYEDAPDQPSLTCRDSGTWDTPSGCERSDTISMYLVKSERAGKTF